MLPAPSRRDAKPDLSGSFNSGDGAESNELELQPPKIVRVASIAPIAAAPAVIRHTGQGRVLVVVKEIILWQINLACWDRPWGSHNLPYPSRWIASKARNLDPSGSPSCPII